MAPSKMTNDAVKAVEDTIAATKETVDEAIRASEQAALRNLVQAQSLGKDQLAEANRRLYDAVMEVASAAQANAEAMVATGTMLSKGLSDVGATWLALSRGMARQGLLAGRSMITARTPNHLVELQNGCARIALEQMLANGSRLSDLSLRLAREVVAPLNERMAASVVRMTRAA